MGGDRLVDIEADRPIQGDLDAIIGDDGDHRPADAERPAQTLRDIGVEGSGIGHVGAHRRISEAEQQIEQSRQQEGSRHARAIAEGEGARRGADHGGQGSGRRDDEKDDLRQADRVLAQMTRRLILHRVFPLISLAPAECGRAALAASIHRKVERHDRGRSTQSQNGARPPFTLDIRTGITGAGAEGNAGWRGSGPARAACGSPNRSRRS